MSAASAGAGSSSAESALSAAAAALVPLGSVFVKRSGDARAHFAKVDIFAGDDVADLAKNASKARGWGVDASYVELFLVPDDLVRTIQLKPSEHEAAVVVGAQWRLPTDSLEAAGIRVGSCLLARLSGPPDGAKRPRTVAFDEPPPAPPPGVVITVRDLEASHKSFNMAVPASWDEFLELLRQLDNYVDSYRLYYYSAGSAPTTKKLACEADFVAYYLTLRMAGRLPDIWVLRAAEMPSPEQLLAAEAAGGAGGGARGGSSNRSSTQQSDFRVGLILRDASGSDVHCALCGKFGEVEAAHIMPQKRSDQFTRGDGLKAAMAAAGLVNLYDSHNGILLCTQCHGFFDSYLWAVNSEGEVELSNALTANVPTLAIFAGKVLFPDNPEIPFVVRANRPFLGVFAWHYQAYQKTTAARHGNVELEIFDCSRCKQRFAQEWRKNKHEVTCLAEAVPKLNFFTPSGNRA